MSGPAQDVGRTTTAVLAVHGDLGPGVVTIPRGDVTARSAVPAAPVTSIGPVVVSGETPYHPENPWWPDQPSDTGRIDVAGDVLPVRDTVLVARGANGSASLVVAASAAALSSTDSASLCAARGSTSQARWRRHPR
jgi:hypothetical protein